MVSKSCTILIYSYGSKNLVVVVVVVAVVVVVVAAAAYLFPSIACLVVV
jgi:hypothetical protein